MSIAKDKKQSSSQTDNFGVQCTIRSGLLPVQAMMHQFSLYCSRRGKQSVSTSYNITQQPICRISSLQQFFQYFLSLKKPSQLLIDSKIMLFYSNCKPFWQEWLNSGCLLIQFKNKEEEYQLLDVIWEFLNYSLVANNLHHHIIGVSLCKRDKITILEIWLRTNDTAIDIGKMLELQILKQLPSNLGLSFNRLLEIKHKRHSDSISTNSTIKGAHKITQVNLKSNDINDSF